jgi:hypothetical protein
MSHCRPLHPSPSLLPCARDDVHRPPAPASSVCRPPGTTTFASSLASSFVVIRPPAHTTEATADHHLPAAPTRGQAWQRIGQSG